MHCNYALLQAASLWSYLLENCMLTKTCVEDAIVIVTIPVATCYPPTRYSTNPTSCSLYLHIIMHLQIYYAKLAQLMLYFECLFVRFLVWF